MNCFRRQPELLQQLNQQIGRGGGSLGLIGGTRGGRQPTRCCERADRSQATGEADSKHNGVVADQTFHLIQDPVPKRQAFALPLQVKTSFPGSKGQLPHLSPTLRTPYRGV